MTHIEQSIVINQSLERVFTYVTDPRNNPKWQPGIVASRVTPDEPTHLGTLSTDVRTVLGRKLELTSEVTEFQPNKLIRLKSVSGPIPFNVTITFEREGDGTKINFQADAQPTGFFKMAEGMLSSTLRKELEASFIKLKEVLEA